MRSSQDSSPDPESTDSRPPGSGGGESIGPYRILSEIGRGGMGVVYKAYHPDLKRTVALKVLIAGEDASEDSIERFHREAEAVAKLGHHPNIVPVYDIGQVGGPSSGTLRKAPIHYIAMHYVEGKALDRLIDDGEIAPKRAAVMALKLAGALQHAHEHGILHRDIKPANVLVSSEGEPQLTDFGLAKDVESESTVTRSGATLGTPQYMSPEQGDGLIHEIDERSDIHSLGATLYEMLTFEPPFTGESVVNVIRKVILEDPIPPRKLNSSVERDLETICLKCMQKEKEKRYDTAEHLAADLDRFLNGEPILARPVSSFEKFLKRAKRNKALTAAVLALVLLLAGGGAGGTVLLKGWMSERDQRREERSARRKAEEGEKDAKQQMHRGGRAAKAFLGAVMKLGPLHRELNANYHDGTKTKEEKREVFEKLRPRIEKSLAGFETSPENRATALAVKGWLSRQGLEGEEALEILAQARKTSPETPWAYLFEAAFWLSETLARQPLPTITTHDGGITYDMPRTEEPGLALARKRFEEAVAALSEAKSWGDDLARDFEGLVEGMKGIGGGDFEAAESGLSMALKSPTFAWIQEELLLARAKVRLFRQRFTQGLEDTDRLIEEHPNCREAHFFRSVLCLGLGMKVTLDGEDPREWLEHAVKDLDRVEEIDPGRSRIRANRGLAAFYLAEARAKRGADPTKFYELAIRDCDGELSDDPGNFDAHLNGANARLGLAYYLAKRGEDSLHLFGEAIATYDALLEEDPVNASVLFNRGTALDELAFAEEMLGQDPRITIGKSIESFEAALKANPGSFGALRNLGNAYLALGDALADRGEDPRSAYGLAIEKCTAALRIEPKDFYARKARGDSRLRLADALTGMGLPAKKEYEKALENYNAVVD
ncbi:MAG: protein kinase domain-containing protein, partial [Planctomycetota bacterium]